MFHLQSGSQQFKFNAYFQYLRSFTEGGLETLHKLQRDFNKQMKKKISNNEVLSVMKTMLSAYQIFILQIKDSCQFVEMGQFGFCISKTFVQLAKMIKELLRLLIQDDPKRQNKRKAKTQHPSANDGQEDPNLQYVCAFCQEISKNPHEKEVKSKRKAVAIIDIDSDMRTAKKNHHNEKNHLIRKQEEILQRYTTKEIESKKQISDPYDLDYMTKKHLTLKIEASNNENILEEVLNEFNSKAESMMKFVNNSQAIYIENYKKNQEVDFETFEKEIRQFINEKVVEANLVLKQIVRNRIIDYEKLKRKNQCSMEVQTAPERNLEKEKLEAKVKEQIKTLKKNNNEIECKEKIIDNLKTLLQSKSIAYEQELLVVRNQTISFDVKTRNMLKSSVSIKQRQNDGNSMIFKSEHFEEEDEGEDIKKWRKSHAKKSIGFKFQKLYTDQNQGIVEQKQSGRTEQIEQIGLKAVEPRYQVDIAVQTDEIKSSIIYSKTDKTRIKQINHTELIDKKQRFQKMVTLLNNNSERYFVKKNNKYSQVKCRVYETKQNRKTSPITESIEAKSTAHRHKSDSIVKKLEFNNTKTMNFNEVFQPQKVECFQNLKEPHYVHVRNRSYGKEDVLNLFLSYKNAHNYECIIFRNKLFTSVNLNVKRTVHSGQKILMLDAEWNYKRQMEKRNTVEDKMACSIFQQLLNIKKKERKSYQDVKLILRHPSEVLKDQDFTQISQPTKANNRDLEYNQILKAFGVIHKMHADCRGDSKEVICEHLMKFCNKIGIEFRQ